MIDHVSIAVRDLDASAALYQEVLGALGLKRLVARIESVAYGKRYPEFWLNRRRGHMPVPADTGAHICLRAPDEAAVRAFLAAALRFGCRDAGAPGPRQGEMTRYYGAFILDPDGNKIEAATFPPTA